MNTLTKLFVGLLIVCSLLLTAGVVVFVNKADTYSTALTTSEQRIKSLESAKQIAVDEAAAARQREADQAKEMNRIIGDLQTQITSSKQDASSRVAETAQLQQRLRVQEANLAESSGAVKVQAQNIADLQKRYDDVVKQLDAIRGENVQLVGANTDYQRRLDTLEREIQYRDELIAQIRATGAAGSQGGAAAPGGAGGARGPGAAADIRGVISSAPRKEGDVTYATISVGSADRVQRGMQFNVIDPQQRAFLGKFIVESVQQNESFGRLEGPRVAEIKTDNEVRTQI